jgi:hypothetical protein
MDGLRNDDGVEWMDVELMSTGGPRANGCGMDEHPGLKSSRENRALRI